MTIDELKADVQEFIHQYLEVLPGDESVIASYVLNTYQPLQNGVIYLLFVGKSHNSKTRAAMLMNALCNRPITLGDCSEAALLMKMENNYPCTLLLDIDGHSREEKTFLKMLLGVVNRKEDCIFLSVAGEFKSFRTFGYKVVFANKIFTSPAIQSHCITIRLEGLNRRNVPTYLLDEFQMRASKIKAEIIEHYKERINP